ncbi:MAG: hypothetical protein ABI467_24185 [Kofleriaceae bacterium]
MGGDSKQQHSDKQADNVDTKPADTSDLQRGGKVVPTPTDQAQQIVRSAGVPADLSPGISGPPTVDLGDDVVGRTHFEELQLFNNQNLDAYVRVHVEGSPAIVLVSAPERLTPSRDGVDPAAAIRLAFSPTAKGRVHGTLVVQAGWQNAIHVPQVLRIPIEAAAHEEGQPSIAEEETDQREQAAKEKAEADDQAQMQHATEAADARLDDPKLANKLPGTAAARQRFQDAETAAGDALSDLFDNRRVGIETAKDEAAKFHRRTPAYEESVLESLAWAALDVATAGIAGALGKKIEGALLKTVGVAEHALPNGGRAAAKEFSPSKSVVAFFTDSMKDVVKRGAGAGTAATKHAAATHTAHGNPGLPTEPQVEDPGPSADPLLAFFQTEKIGLIDQHRGKATTVAQHARYALEPMLDDAPRQAIAAMVEIAAGIRDVTGQEIPANKQALASATHWIEYVAQASLGVVSSDEARRDHKRVGDEGESTTSITSANAAPTVRGAPSAHDGLVDLKFVANRSHPTEPVTILSGRVHGVSKDTYDHLRRIPLREAHVPVRAYAIPNGTDAVVGLEAIRDEAGNVEFTDDTGAPGMPGHWFASRIGEPAGGPDAQIRGARELMEEMVSTRLPQQVEDDSDA